MKTLELYTVEAISFHDRFSAEIDGIIVKIISVQKHWKFYSSGLETVERKRNDCYHKANPPLSIIVCPEDLSH